MKTTRIRSEVTQLQGKCTITGKSNNGPHVALRSCAHTPKHQPNNHHHKIMLKNRRNKDVSKNNVKFASLCPPNAGAYITFSLVRAEQY